jgi:hypothetical protein
MSKLVEIGKMLKAKAQAHPDHDNHFNLANGLGIRMARSGIYWKLRLTRDNVAPGEAEVAIVRRDFDVPPEAYRTDSVQGCVHAVQLSWPESTVTP